MEFNINNNKFEVSWQDGQTIVRTEKGEFRRDYAKKREIQEDDMPALFFDAMSGAYEGEAFPGYRDWLDYIGEKTSRRNHQDHAKFLEQAKQWHKISEVSADNILTYLAGYFDI